MPPADDDGGYGGFGEGDGPGSAGRDEPTAGAGPPDGRNVPLLLVLQRPELRITAAVGEAVPDGDPAGAVGRPLAAAFPELATGPTLAAVERAFATGRPETVRSQNLAPPTPAEHVPRRRFDLRVTPVLAPDGTVGTVVLDAARTAAEAAGDAAEEVVARVTAEAAEEEAVMRAADPRYDAPARADDSRAAVAEQAYAEARDVIAAVQNELLPPGVPVLPTVRLAAAYLPAGTETSAGGDWFEAIRLPDGRIGLAVGDVVGHGVTASTAMGQLRVLLRERLMDTGSVTATLDFLDRAAERVRGARAATVCLAILHPESGRLEYSTAGHPPPLLVGPAGGARFLVPTGAAPLGVGRGYPPSLDRLEPSDTLLMYTDGLVERPGRTLSEGIEELAGAAADVCADQLWRTGACDPRRLADRTVQRLIGESGFRDDIAVLAAQLRAAPDGLDLLVPADGERLAELREGFGAWLAEIGVYGYHVQLLQHAVGELAANAVEHAYRGMRRRGLLAVRARLTVVGDIVVRVVDQGRWSEPDSDPERGVGLGLVTDLVDDLRLEHDKGGTTATIRHHPWIAAHSPAAADLAVRLPNRPAAPDPFLVLSQPSAPRRRVRVDGPVDAQNAPTLYLELRAASAAGTRDVTVDLTGTTYLASAGIAVLHRLCAQAAHNKTELRLYAPPGSPAQMVMSLARLQHHTVDPDGDEPGAAGF